MSQRSNLVCPQCGDEIPENAPQGLCTKCMLKCAATAIRGSESTGIEAAPMSYRSARANWNAAEIDRYFED